jgi:predicted ribosomally synthesized peptide with SipW-like signal peptide
MTKKLLISLSVIGIAAVIAVSGTTAYFSDTEANHDNVFAAGEIDIQVEGDGFEWSAGAEMKDMKPCYTDYVNLVIRNNEPGANPVNIWKDLKGLGNETTGVETEPECTDQGGVWDYNDKACDWDGSEEMKTDKNNLSNHIWYDLYVEVYDESGKKIWYQTIYVDEDEQSLDDVFGGSKDVYLGMIPAGGKMKVKQSYHLAPYVGNWAQGDELKFDIEIYGEQLHGEVVLENKEGAEPWHLLLVNDDISGKLTYDEVKAPTFDYTFTGTAPLPETRYCLWIGGTPIEGDWDADIKLGCARSNGDRYIEISDNKDLGKDVINGKAWLIKEDDYDENGWNAYHPTDYLWETGLIWYEDTDN